MSVCIDGCTHEGDRVREEAEMHELPSYRSILFATDGSDFAALAEDHALALARQTGARMEGLCVVDRHLSSQLGALGPEVADELRRDSQAALDKLAVRAQQVGVDVGT